MVIRSNLARPAAPFSAQGIDTVLFDLDGTLRLNRPSSEQIFFTFASQLGVTDSPENHRLAKRWAHAYWAQSPMMLSDMETLGGLSDIFWINYARRRLVSFGCSDDQAQHLALEMHRLFSEQYQSQEWIPSDVPETLAWLKSKGFRLGVLSNRSTSFAGQLAELGLDVYFECVVAAGEVGSWKPDPGIFYHALQQLGSQSDSAVYVGDNYYADVIGAQAAGLQPVLYDPEDVFPEAGCLVIRTMGELIDLLPSS